MGFSNSGGLLGEGDGVGDRETESGMDTEGERVEDEKSIVVVANDVKGELEKMITEVSTFIGREDLVGVGAGVGVGIGIDEPIEEL